MFLGLSSAAAADSDPAGEAGADSPIRSAALAEGYRSPEVQSFGAPGTSSSGTAATIPPFRRHLIGRPNAITWGLGGGILTGWVALAAEGDVERIEGVGDSLRFGIPVAGLGLALGNKDWNGTYRLLISVAATQVATTSQRSRIPIHVIVLNPPPWRPRSATRKTL